MGTILLSMSKKWYKSKSAVICFHILAWVLLFSLPALFHRENDQPRINWKGMTTPKALVFDACFVSLFYLNSLVLIPRLLNRKRFGAYISSVVILFVFVLIILPLVPSENRQSGFHRESFFLVFPFLFIWAMSTAYRFFSDQVETEQLLKERENENLKTELSFLRSQVSPHFLFNVLNNMVAMARLKSELLEPSLIRLSGLMRYMLYESDEAKVPLSREVEYVNSYMELQKMRYTKSLSIKTDMDPGGNELIEPMLLIPFIENAFKHGTGVIEDPVIEISLKQADGLIDFRVKNKYIPDAGEIKDKTSGIGLSNVKRRLNLLYAHKHMLSMDKENGWFAVSLQIKLHGQ
ncbi:MAG: histidine kinase [Bacteroidota bacterium]|nr:histidine kinase [Bacteroidota bacterium]MDP4213626.1 histidine kinase [Bacteroidota bacterium]MDP4248470.1 histidine kinase [Bacteroidota bacterium]